MVLALHPPYWGAYEIVLCAYATMPLIVDLYVSLLACLLPESRSILSILMPTWLKDLVQHIACTC
jgi:hypothetical protein